MNTRYTTVNLDVSQQGSIPSITLSQYDLGVGLGFYIMDGGLPYSAFAETDTVVLSGTKPSGVGFTIPAYYKSENLCSFRTTQAMTTEAGTVTCEITITKVNNISVSTANFFVEVEASAHAHETVDEDIEDFGLIADQVGEYKVVAVRAAQQAAQSATDAAASAFSAEESMEAAQSAASSAIAAKDDIQEYIDDSEAWARGTRGGTAVPSTDETYENNAKYYAEQSSASALAAGVSQSEAAASAQEAAASVVGAVKYTAQTLTTEQKAQARTNIGAASPSDIPSGTVRYDTSQSLTDAQKTQAKNNIGVPAIDATLAVTGAAADAKKVGDELTDLKGDLSELGSSDTVKALIGNEEPFSVLNITGSFDNVSTPTAQYFSDRVIPKGSYITKVKSIGTPNGRFGVFFIEESTKIVRKISRGTFDSNGVCELAFDYLTDCDVIFGISGHFKYVRYQSAISDSFTITDGVQSINKSIDEIEIGDVVSYSKNGAGFWYKFPVEIDGFSDFHTRMSKLDYAYDYAINGGSGDAPIVYKEYDVPLLYQASHYITPTADHNYLYTFKAIPKGAELKSLQVITGNSGINNGKVLFCVIDKESKKIVYVVNQSVPANSTATIPLDYTTNNECYFSVNGPIKHNNQGTTVTDYTFNPDGLYYFDATSVAVGDTITINQVVTDFLFDISVSLKYMAGSTEDSGIEDVKKEISFLSASHAYDNKWLPKNFQINMPLFRYACDDNQQYWLNGRWYKKTVNNVECWATNNVGSEIHLKTIGASTLTINWVAMTNTAAYYAYNIDGGANTRTSITNNTITLPDTNEHYVRINTDGIAPDNIGKWESGNGFAFSDISVNTGKTVAAIPANPMVMFFGDSITEGLRALGIDDTDGGNVCSGMTTYTRFCSDKIGAIPFFVGYGGTGVNTGTSHFNEAIIALQYYYNGKKVDTVYPSAIVINHGTNDGSSSSSVFISKYTAYLNKIKIMYPGVPVFCVIPFSQRHAADIRSVVNTLGWPILVETSEWNITYTDESTVHLHPNAEGARTAGENLADFILDYIYGSDS